MVELSDILLILLVAILVLGPKDLSGLFRKAGRAAFKIGRKAMDVADALGRATGRQAPADLAGNGEGTATAAMEGLKEEVERVMETAERKTSTLLDARMAKGTGGMGGVAANNDESRPTRDN